MQKDDKGTWSITIDSLPPSVYIYHFFVDGITIDACYGYPVRSRLTWRIWN